MSDRCLSLHADEVRRLLAGASVIVRPFKVQPPPTATVEVKPFRDLHADRYPLWAGWWADSHGGRAWTMSPLAPGDIMVGREGWRWDLWAGAAGIVYGVQYRADGHVVAHRDQDFARVALRRTGGFRLTPQTMPAALSRIRRRVVRVEAKELPSLTDADWRASGFRGSEIATPTEQAYAWWLSRYGPGSWARWVWFMTVERRGGEHG